MVAFEYADAGFSSIDNNINSHLKSIYFKSQFSVEMKYPCLLKFNNSYRLSRRDHVVALCVNLYFGCC